MKIFKEWTERPAKWWQFWMPGSGMIGGFIFGMVLNILIYGVII